MLISQYRSVTIVGAKRTVPTKILSELAKKNSYLSKNKIIPNFVKFVPTKKLGHKFFRPSFVAVVGSEIWDPISGTWDG